MAAKDVSALAREAERLLRIGRASDAEHVCKSILKSVPDQPKALMISSSIFMAAGRWAEAEAALLSGCAAHPRSASFHAALGRLRLHLNQHAQAVAPLENCVLLEPGAREHRVTLLGLYQLRRFASFSEASNLAMLACLADDTLTHSLLSQAWLSLLRVDPGAQPLLALFDSARTYSEFRAGISPDLTLALQNHALFQAGLRRFLATDVAVERGLTFLRRWLFEQPRQELPQYLPLLCALARYCLLSEYVFESSESYPALRENLATPAVVALLACYESSHALGPAALPALAQLSAEPCYRDLVQAWLEEPVIELALRDSVATLTSIDDDVSRAVQAQYEQNPYPRWTTVGAIARDTGSRGQGRRVLVAGCGTGREALEMALNFAAAQIDALDLSRASLAYAMRKARELGASNVCFAQADILNLGQRAPDCDLISAVGVLHHLREPRAGLAALLALLAPGGVLRIALYSRLARTAVVAARAFIQEAGFEPNASGIRAFRQAVLARPEDDPMRGWLTRSPDFYALSQCRDLVFHVQEHTFTLPEIAELLRALELSVLHVEVKNPSHAAEYRQRFPEDAAATRLRNWHRLEQLQPQMFAGMYALWLCRSAEESRVDASWLNVT